MFFAGAIASGVNAVAGGGTLLSFPALVAFGIPTVQANATNAVALWPGSLAGGFGFINLLPKTGKHLRLLLVPTILGAGAGALLFMNTSERIFTAVIPFLIAAASLLLLMQPRVKKLLGGEHRTLPAWGGAVLQFLVSLYGGYFGAGMGIMMLAAFALYMEGNVHELNAVKNWLGLLINFAASILFIIKGLVLVGPALALASGSIVGGFVAARGSQRIAPDKLRIAIAMYGLAMACFFAYRALRGS